MSGRSGTQSHYTPRALEAEGFIHCSTREQAVATANNFFRGQRDLLILRIDENRLRAELRYETPATEGDNRARELFPHIYGPLNLDAVVAVDGFPCNPEGLFDLPASISE